MAFRIVRNDITKMTTEAIVNTANEHAEVGWGCDSAVYKAAGFDELLAYRTEKIGYVPEGEVFITPGFHLAAKYIIHAVSPLYLGGDEREEEKLRSCYRKSLELAREKGIRSIAFPLIATGGYGYPKEEGMRIALDEILAFLMHHEMDVYLAVFDEKALSLGRKIHPGLEEYIDRNYVTAKHREEYDEDLAYPFSDELPEASSEKDSQLRNRGGKTSGAKTGDGETWEIPDFETEHESRLEERMRHVSDTFSQYLMYLIREKNMQNAEVYKRAIVDKKIFSKIKNNADYHPQKLTALCLCIGAKLNMEEARDLLSRAGYALSPSDKTDIIFSYFIENQIYDMIELDIQLEEHGLPCIIS